VNGTRAQLLKALINGGAILDWMRFKDKEFNGHAMIHFI